jgi:outer membrane protein OmpA-like peptidoglycan-associated protein
MNSPIPLRYSSALALALSLVGASFAQTVTETRTTETTYSTTTESKSTKPTIEPTRAASVTPYATPGMSHVISAQGVGAGRANMQLRGNFYKQDATVVGAPAEGSQITTVSGGVALGLNEYVDVFGILNIYNLRSSSSDGSGFGSSILGAQVGIPFSRDTPIRVAVQAAGIFGTAKSQLNTNGLDGYNYLETRTGNDFMVRVVQSLLFTNDAGVGFNVHLNEGVISSLESGKDISLITGAGVEVIPLTSLILGLEANSRTFLNAVDTKDPLWVTPSVTWRTPAFVNINIGADIALSKEREPAPAIGVDRALEPWRIFGGLTYSIDTKAGEKKEAQMRAREAAAKARADSLERAALARQANRADSRADSLARANALNSARSKAIADSLRMKAYNDSVAAARALAEERSKRSEMEKQLLSTGLLLLDAVYFETGKTQISINSEPYLSLIAKMLTKYPKLQIEIGGHTDNVGGLNYNQNLSQGRAAAVVSYMVKEAPDLQGRLTAKGYAYSQPKADNKTAAGRQLNRRTELKVINKEALKEYNP